MRVALPRVLAVIGVAIAALAAVLALVLDIYVTTQGDEPTAVAPGWSSATLGVAATVGGAVILWRVGWQAVGTVLLLLGLPLTLLGVAFAWVNLAVVFWRDAPAAAFALGFVQRGWGLLAVALPLVLSIFPDGRAPARSPWRWFAVVSWIASAIVLIVALFAPLQVTRSDMGQLD